MPAIPLPIAARYITRNGGYDRSILVTGYDASEVLYTTRHIVIDALSNRQYRKALVMTSDDTMWSTIPGVTVVPFEKEHVLTLMHEQNALFERRRHKDDGADCGGDPEDVINVLVVAIITHSSMWQDEGLLNLICNGLNCGLSGLFVTKDPFVLCSMQSVYLLQLEAIVFNVNKPSAFPRYTRLHLPLTYINQMAAHIQKERKNEKSFNMVWNRYSETMYHFKAQTDLYVPETTLLVINRD